MSDAPAAAADVEKASVSAGGDGGASGGGGAVGAILGRWRRQDLLDKSGSALRAAAWAFSLLAFLVMVCNQHGDWKQFDRYEEYRCTSSRSGCSRSSTPLCSWCGTASGSPVARTCSPRSACSSTSPEIR
uniref:Uncharacterized protein n=1 Tax=Avena sativa TaxID=4498 RepID=A0ACD5TLU5_AVESA